MSYPINTLPGGGLLSANLGNQIAQSFWGSRSENKELEGPWGFFADQCALKVTMCLKGVGDKIVMDLAAVTADYMVDKPELQEDYVLVIVDDPLQGREARAYKRADLVADLESPKKEEALEALEKNPLLYHTSAADLPPIPDDENLNGLAAKVQDFLDVNDKVLNILARDGLLPWG